MHRSILDFPVELIFLLIFLLDGTSVTNLSKTCRSFRKYCSKRRLWKGLCKIECPDIPIDRFKGHYRMLWKYNKYIQTKNDLVPELLENIEKRIRRYDSIRELRIMLCWPFDQPEIPIGIGSVLLPILRDGSIPEKTESVRCIVNMAANAAPGSNKHTEFAKPLTEILVMESDPDLVYETLAAIRNIAGDSLQNRDFILNISALIPIVSLMKREIQQKNKHSIRVINSAAMTITALCRKKPAPPIIKVSVLLPVLIELIYYDDDELLGNVLWAYSGITEQSSKPHINAVAEQKITKRLIELVLRPSKNIYYPAMRVIGNILVSDAEEHTRMFLFEGILNILEKFLHHPELTMRKEAIWSLSNIAATSPDCIQAIIDYGLIPAIIKKIGEDDPFVRKEAAFTIANSIWKGNPKQARVAVKGGCLPLMVQLAMLQGTAEQVLQLVMETFENLLKPEIPPEERAEYAAEISECGRGFLQYVLNTQTTTASINLANNVMRKLPPPQPTIAV